MSGLLKSYNPREVQIIIGTIIVGGYAPGTFLDIGRTSETFAGIVGADGEGARAQSNDRSGNAIITLMQTAQSNIDLTALHILDENTGGGVVPLLVKDLGGAMLYSAECCYLTGYPRATLGQEIDSRVWNLWTPNLIIGGVGGN